MKKCFFILFIMILPFSLWAKVELEAPLVIRSDTARYDHNKGEAIHEGNVHVTQGEKSLYSDTLVVVKDTQGKIAKIETHGKPATFESQKTVKTPQMQGQANEIVYLPAENLIVLIGDATLVQDHDTFKGPKITFNLTDKTVISETENNERPTMIINRAVNS